MYAYDRLLNKVTMYYELYEIVVTLLTVTDIDECQAGVNSCSQNCSNSEGGFACTCFTGYTLLDDTITCERKLNCCCICLNI